MATTSDGDKESTASASSPPQLESFLSIGLDQRTAENALANRKVTANLTAVIAEAGVTRSDKSVGNLLYTVATKYPTNALVHRPDLIKYILSEKSFNLTVPFPDKKLCTTGAALTFLSTLGPDSLDSVKFEAACGVGVVVSFEEIQSTVTDVLNENMESIVEQRYRINVGSLCGQVRKRHPWGDAKSIKEIEKRLVEILGPKTEADNAKPMKKKEKPVKVEEEKTAVAVATPEEEVNPYSIFPQPEENFKVHTEIFFSDGNIWRAHNTKSILEKHLKATGGKVMTRFPPEPNGYLHIGRAKLCTLEFDIRRPSYYWLLVALGQYQPYVWEYSRLNISNNVMSKRKLNQLVTDKWVDGWDDPRLLTLAGLRRRGVSAAAINSFIRGMGITRSDNSLIRVERLEYHIREELNKVSPRALVVLHPLKVVITNLDYGMVINLDAKMWPNAPDSDASAHYKVPFSRIVYIEQSDFRLKDSKDFYGLAPGKSVMLRHAFPIKCTEVIYGDNADSIVEIRAMYDASKATKPKGVLHWIAEPSPGVEPLKVEVRLFLSENPAELDNWLGDLNPQSKEVIKGAYAVPSLASAMLGDKFQFERLGYFAVDSDSTLEELVFDRTVTLKDSYGKAGPK
ncbi:unnamed protein product [Miscanthus lutarioriparius]|uniref:glutamine--tRNA ligase n=1 Tax=Miscanthus lutarioriparius TaxID=422564 RepID=A0A811RRH2_9POAL|nr:unnamed protein product [Miscanthus lutarioriparius]